MTISDNVVLLTHDYSLTIGLRAAGLVNDEEKAIVSGISIGDNTFLGMNSMILPGARIGNDVIVGAGAVVRGHVPDGVIVLGNPSEIVGRTAEWAQRRVQTLRSDQVVDSKLLKSLRPLILCLRTRV